MMNSKIKLNESQLLRKYIRESLLSEQEFGGTANIVGDYMDPAAYAMVGASGGDPSGLINTFITPFTDVFKTAAAQTKMLAQDSKVLLQVAFKTALSTIIPGIGQRYDKIFAARDKKIEEIKSEYKEVFDRTDEALKGDAKLLAFMVAPGAFLAGSAALKVPEATKEVLSVATGGLSDDAFDGAKSAWDNIQERILAGEKAGDLKRERAELEDDFVALLTKRIKSKSRRNESLIRVRKNILLEDEKKNPSKKSKDFGAFLKDMLSSKKVVDALSELIKNNPDLQDLKEKLTKTEDETLKSAEELALNVVGKVNSFQDIEKLVAGDNKAKQQLDKIKNIKDQKEKDAAIKMLADNIKAASKQTFIATLSSRMKMFPKGSDLHKKYEDSLKKLK